MKWDFVLWHHFLFPSTTLYPFDKQQITKNQVVIATTKIDIFKQITTVGYDGTEKTEVVIATTKIDIFKQITTRHVIVSMKRSCYCYHKDRYF